NIQILSADLFNFLSKGVLLFTIMKSLIFFACVFISVISISMAKECSSPKDCEPGECCVLGMQRYSSAWCKPLGKQDDFCRSDNPAVDRVIEYPNGLVKHFHDVHILFCPCEENLNCSRAQMERYAIPRCEPKGKMDSFCREDGEPDNRMLLYPNFIFRYIEDMYTLFCPCEEPLVCRKNKCSKG
ncbi:uncharacterized protein TNCT_701541, partial [Trichonephila clavata]